MAMPQLKPSPVHESSLRHALQRVEDRLRKQDEKRKKNEYHIRTLKLAREFAAQGVLQRKRDWERQNPEKKQIDANKTIKNVIPIQEASITQQPVAGSKNAPIQIPSEPIEALHSAPDKTPPKGLMRLMPIVAWLILGTGIIGAFLSWTTITDVRANTFQLEAANFNTLPIGLLLGFAYLATGVLGFAFFWVSSLISNQLKEIRRLLSFQPTMDKRSNQSQS